MTGRQIVHSAPVTDPVDLPRFDGKVVFITGAGHGIGRATALRLASEGAAIVVTDVRPDTAEETAAMIRDDGTGAGLAATRRSNREKVPRAGGASVHRLH